MKYVCMYVCSACINKYVLLPPSMPPSCGIDCNLGRTCLDFIETPCDIVSSPSFVDIIGCNCSSCCGYEFNRRLLDIDNRDIDNREIEIRNLMNTISHRRYPPPSPPFRFLFASTGL